MFVPFFRAPVATANTLHGQSQMVTVENSTNSVKRTTTDTQYQTDEEKYGFIVCEIIVSLNGVIVVIVE